MSSLYNKSLWLDIRICNVSQDTRLCNLFIYPFLEKIQNSIAISHLVTGILQFLQIFTCTSNNNDQYAKHLNEWIDSNVQNMQISIKKGQRLHFLFSMHTPTAVQATAGWSKSIDWQITMPWNFGCFCSKIPRFNHSLLWFYIMKTSVCLENICI